MPYSGRMRARMVTKTEEPIEEEGEGGGFDFSEYVSDEPLTQEEESFLNDDFDDEFDDDIIDFESDDELEELFQWDKSPTT